MSEAPIFYDATAEPIRVDRQAEWPTIVADQPDDALEVPDAPLDADFATPDDFFNVAPPLDELWAPELGRKVRLRILSGKEADAYRASIIIGRGQNISVDQRGMRAKLAVLALANPDGSRMFKDADVPKVMTWPSVLLERIFDRARKINGLTERDTDDEKNG